MDALLPPLIFFSLLLNLILLTITHAQPSLDPPAGNTLKAKFAASGYQIYECQQALTGAYLYQHLTADTQLFHGNGTLFGYHYFLPKPDSGGGQPTWSSFNSINNDGVPDSTVTGLAIKNRANQEAGSISDLLLRATSHSGFGFLGQVSYIQRLNSRNGAISNQSCTAIGQILSVPYTADYAFWNQDELSLPPTTPAVLLPPPGHKPMLNLYGQGFQVYEYNGSNWVVMNVTSTLFPFPGSQQQLGAHFFLPQMDNKDVNATQTLQPSWTLFFPSSLVAAKPLISFAFDPDSINWLLLQATSHTGDDPSGFGSVSYVLRLSTIGGLPPNSTKESVTVGETYRSPYSAIYWFYVPNNLIGPTCNATAHAPFMH